jgi:hypothetical protein
MTIWFVEHHRTDFMARDEEITLVLIQDMLSVE